MAPTVFGIIGSILAILAAFAAWWFKTEDQRRRDRLIARIKDLERRHDEALARGDMAAVAQCQRELIWLRKEIAGNITSKRPGSNPS